MADTNHLTLPRLGFMCFTLAIVLLPWGLGGNRPLPFGLAQALLAAAAFIAMRQPALLGEVYFFTRLRIALGLLFAVCLWAWLQTTPFFPASWNHPLWQEAASQLPVPVHGTIAIVPDQSLYGLSRLVTYSACGLLAFIFGQNANNGRRFLKIFWHAGAALCVYGLAVYAAGNKTILWFPKWAYENDLTASFVNRNHFAVFAGMVFTTGSALLLQSWRDRVATLAAPHPAGRVRRWLLKKFLPQLTLLLLVFMCLLLSHSRAGLVLTVLGSSAYFFFHQLYQKAWMRSLVMGVIALIALAGALLLAEHFSDRFNILFHDNSSIDRFRVYHITWNAIQANPWLGYGLDGFDAVFRFYQPGMVMEFNRAHSDILESLLDLGIPFGAALWLALLLVLSGLLHGVLNRRRHGIYPCLGLAVSLIVLGHAFIDFSLQIPGVVCAWVALVGIGLAQSWGTSEKQALIEKR